MCPGAIWCGGHQADACGDCGTSAGYCNGDCKWLEYESYCSYKCKFYIINISYLINEFSVQANTRARGFLVGLLVPYCSEPLHLLLLAGLGAGLLWPSGMGARRAVRRQADSSKPFAVGKFK